jgi:hypothetical protein
MAANGTIAYVAETPDCDIHFLHGPAYADAKIPGGPWGNLCRSCFDRFGCKLGLGQGQELKLESERPKKERFAKPGPVIDQNKPVQSEFSSQNDD